MRPPRRPEYPYQVGVGCGKWASSPTQNFLFGPWVYYSRYVILFLNGRYYGVCLPLLSDSSSALSVSCTLVFGDAGCAPEAAQSSQSVGRCVPGIPDQIPGLCCYLGSPATTMHLGPWSNKRAILTRSWEPCTLLTVMCCDKVRLPLARGFGLTTDLSYSITCWSSFLNYSAISTVTAILLTDHRCRLICYYIAQTALSSLWRLAVKQGSSAYWVQPSVWFRSSTGVDPPCPKTWSNYSTHFPSHFLGTCIYSQDLEVLSNFCWKPDFLHACPKHTFAFQSLQP